MPKSGLVAAGAAGYLPRVHADHAQALADAALFDDADALVRRALDMLVKDGNEIEMAGALVTAAEIRLAQRDHAGARRAADAAAGWYRKQGRDGWVAITSSLALQSAAREEQPPVDVADQLDAVAGRLDGDGLFAEATRSRLVAALARVESSVVAIDDPVPADTRRRIRHGPAADRILLAHVDAVAAHGVAIVRRRGGRSAVASLPRWRAKPPSVRSRHVLMPRCTATPSPRSGRAWPSPIGGHASCSPGSKRRG